MLLSAGLSQRKPAKPKKISINYIYICISSGLSSSQTRHKFLLHPCLLLILFFVTKELLRDLQGSCLFCQLVKSFFFPTFSCDVYGCIQLTISLPWCSPPRQWPVHSRPTVKWCQSRCKRLQTCRPADIQLLSRSATGWVNLCKLLKV